VCLLVFLLECCCFHKQVSMLAVLECKNLAWVLTAEVLKHLLQVHRCSKCWAVPQLSPLSYLICDLAQRHMLRQRLCCRPLLLLALHAGPLSVSETGMQFLCW
jgi:hypothetical protein